MKTNEDCYMLRVTGKKYYCITWDLPICNLCSKFEGNGEIGVFGKQENELLFESSLTEMTGFTTF